MAVLAKTPFHRAFCTNLRLTREAKGLTQSDVADMLGITRASYTAIETGKASPSLSTVERVAKALKVNPTELVSGLAAVA